MPGSLSGLEELVKVAIAPGLHGGFQQHAGVGLVILVDRSLREGKQHFG